jgi:quercetin dioxygenase-like cupin family protein
MGERRTPLTAGATRAGPGDHVFDLECVNHIHAGPDYSTSQGSVVEGDRMMVALMRMSAGTGADEHWHPSEQWIYVLQGTLRGVIDAAAVEAKAGSVIFVPANAKHSLKATEDGDVVFFTVKDTAHSIHGIASA